MEGIQNEVVEHGIVEAVLEYGRVHLLGEDLVDNGHEFDDSGADDAEGLLAQAVGGVVGEGKGGLGGVGELGDDVVVDDLLDEGEELAALGVLELQDVFFLHVLLDTVLEGGYVDTFLVVLVGVVLGYYVRQQNISVCLGAC